MGAVLGSLTLVWYRFGVSTSILIDATHYQLPQPTGVEHYVDKLLPRVCELLTASGVAVSCVGHVPRVLPGATWLTDSHVPGWFQRKLPNLAREHDLFWTPSGTGIVWPPCKQVVTVHDLGVYLIPHRYGLQDRLRTKLLARLAAKRSVAVITPSEYVRTDVSLRWDIPYDRIHVTRLAPVLAERSLPPRIQVPESFLLYVGRLDPTKGVDMLVRVLEAMPSARLVVAGRGDASLFPAKFADRTCLLGYVSEEEKRWLYEHATCLLMPSVSEGFGIPVAEALTLGCPVVAANAGPLPEFGEVGTHYVDPHRVSAWVDAVEKLTHQRFDRKTIASAQHLSWEATAQQTAEVLLAEASQPRQR